jgi:pyruvate kinase
MASVPSTTALATSNTSDVLKTLGYAKKGDTFIITKGDLTGQEGGTNALKVVTVGEGLIPA